MGLRHAPVKAKPAPIAPRMHRRLPRTGICRYQQGMTEGLNDPRKERLAAALRENLRRRKAQSRAGESGSKQDGDGVASPGPPKTD
jgi:hypothetical protein